MFELEQALCAVSEVYDQLQYIIDYTTFEKMMFTITDGMIKFWPSSITGRIVPLSHYYGNVEFNRSLKDNVPNDLLQAYKKGQISLCHIATHTDMSITIRLFCTQETKYMIQCNIPVYRESNKMKLTKQFLYSVHET